MKIASIQFLAAILFSALVPLRAQTNAPAENAANQSVAVTASAPASNSIAATGSNYGNAGVSIGDQNFAEAKIPGLGRIHVSGKTDVGDVVVIVGVLSMPVAIMAIMFYTIHRRNKLVHETIRAMVEKGIPMTPELIASVKPKGSAANFQVKLDGGNTRTRHLLPGLILVGAGLGGMLIDVRWALIILLVGIAFLIVWLVERKQNNTEPPKS